MRCLACNRKLNDYERTRKYASSGAFVDLCNGCFSEVSDDIPDLEGDGFDHASDEALDEVLDPSLGVDGFRSFGDPYDES